jgi:hypothetical protein
VVRRIQLDENPFPLSRIPALFLLGAAAADSWDTACGERMRSCGERMRTPCAATMTVHIEADGIYTGVGAQQPNHHS